MNEQNRRIDIQQYFPEVPAFENEYKEDFKTFSEDEGYLYAVETKVVVDPKTKAPIGLTKEEIWVLATKKDMMDNVALKEKMIAKEEEQILQKERKLQSLQPLSESEQKEIARYQELHQRANEAGEIQQLQSQINDHRKNVNKHREFLAKRATTLGQ